jgi:ornithine cyclodeaminase/alanine dehydrogenase-like protein (mu-crystallin family)
MLVVTAAQAYALAPMPRLIEALRDAFRTGCVAPVRQVASVPGGSGDRIILSMPAFDLDGSGVVKLVTVFPDNRDRFVPTVRAIIVVFSDTGEPVAILDGTTVTQLRTAAASALASTYLSRDDSTHLVIIGTGALAPYMALAHCAVRPIRSVTVWGRRGERALATAATIRSMLGNDIEILGSTSLEQALATADIVSCATTSVTPVLRGEWLQPGTLVDLVGGYSADRREADDTVVQRSRIFVDTLAGAMEEAGDILDPLARGVIRREKIEGELADLVTGRTSGRRSRDEIIMFKSVGAAIEDLAAARLVIGAIRDGGYAGLPT